MVVITPGSGITRRDSRSEVRSGNREKLRAPLYRDSRARENAVVFGGQWNARRIKSQVPNVFVELHRAERYVVRDTDMMEKRLMTAQDYLHGATVKQDKYVILVPGNQWAAESQTAETERQAPSGCPRHSI